MPPVETARVRAMPETTRKPANMETYRRADIGTLNAYVDDAIAEAGKDPTIPLVDYYRKLAASFPTRMPIETFATVRSAILAGQKENPTENESNIAQQGKKVLTMLSINTVLTVAERYEQYNHDDMGDMIQEGITAIYEDADKMSTTKVHLLKNAHRTARFAIEKYLGERDGIPANWVTNAEIIPRTDAAIATGKFNREIDDARRQEIVDIARDLKISPEMYETYLVSRTLFDRDMSDTHEMGTYPPPAAPTLDRVEDHVDIITALNKVVKKGGNIMTDAQTRERDFRRTDVQSIAWRFGLVDGHPMKLDDIGEEQMNGVTGERVRQRQAKVIDKIKKNSDHPNKT